MQKSVLQSNMQKIKVTDKIKKEGSIYLKEWHKEGPQQKKEEGGERTGLTDSVIVHTTRE